MGHIHLMKTLEGALLRPFHDPETSPYVTLLPDSRQINLLTDWRN
jgi:hypothetical protein